MNFRTTIAVVFLALILVIGYMWMQIGAKAEWLREREQLASKTAAPRKESAAVRDVLDGKLGDVVKVVVRKAGHDAWTFEKKSVEGGDAKSTWHLTSPAEFPCASWEVDRFGRDLGKLQYEVSYKTGDAGAPSLSQAGLEPPEATVTLTDDKGVSAVLEIGQETGGGETYVRMPGGDRIFVGKSNLRGLLKSKAVEYRDTQLYNFVADHATRVEIDDRSDAATVHYVFTREGAGWRMESPAAAKATGKVDEMLRALARFRVTQWHDDHPDRISAYGLQPAALTLRVTVEEAISAKTDDKEGEAGAPVGQDAEKKTEEPPQKKISVFELHLSNRTPIGEDTKVYVRSSDESAVAVAMKSTTDKLKPVMVEWRDMNITSAPVDAASKIELTTAEGAATFVKKDDKWVYESDSAPAEGSVLSEWLKALKDLNAAAFVDGVDVSAAGLSSPRADIRITIPGADAVEHITVGGFTDPASKSLVYVRRGEGPTLAKVRAADADKLIRSPSAFRDRTIFSVPADEIQAISLDAESRFGAARTSLKLEKKDNLWTMTQPVAADVRADRATKLAGALAGLKAVAVAGDAGRASAFGLNDPKVRISLVRQPPAENRPGLDADGSAAPPPTTFDLFATEHEGKCYARPSDRSPVYEIARDVFDQFFAEFRTAEVFKFDPAQVRQLSVRSGNQTHELVKQDAKWVYQPEPDLPIDAKKVDAWLTKLKDLKTERYVAYGADLAKYGLALPVQDVAVTFEDGSLLGISISSQSSERPLENGQFAARKHQSDVFLLNAEAVQGLKFNLGDFEKK